MSDCHDPGDEDRRPALGIGEACPFCGGRVAGLHGSDPHRWVNDERIALCGARECSELAYKFSVLQHMDAKGKRGQMRLAAYRARQRAVPRRIRQRGVPRDH